MKMNTGKDVSSYSKTTKEGSAQRIQDLAYAIAHPSGIPHAGAQIIGQLIATLEVRITDLEEQIASFARVQSALAAPKVRK